MKRKFAAASGLAALVFGLTACASSESPLDVANEWLTAYESGDVSSYQALMDKEATYDCIDCGYCVQVCPTGIDIRNGLQIQCISCALCIDACDTIMDSLHWPRGLVGYTSERREQTGERARWLRPKVIGYAAVLLLAVGLLVWSVKNQAPFDLTVAQVREPIYVQLSDGRIQNNYEIKVNNKTGRVLVLRFEVQDLMPDAELDMGRFREVSLQPEQRLRLAAKISAQPTVFDGNSHPFRLVAVPQNAPTLPPIEHPGVFFVPRR